MGLPLFIAPVESDLKPKASDKNNHQANARSWIRRSRQRLDDREARALRRRAAILREHFPIDPPSSSRPGPWDDAGGLPPPSDPPARYPWIESGELPPAEAYASTSRADRSLRPERPDRPERPERPDRPDRTRSRAANENTLLSLFGERYVLGNRNESATPPNAPEDSGRTSRLVRGFSSGLGEVDFSELDNVYSRDRIDPSISARFDRSPDRLGIGRRTSWRPGHGWVRENRVPRVPTRPTGRRSTAMDGLGDRTRSLSPEVWDTLLTTLTPDPQPPSAGSSFASASAGTSQNTAASSRTSFGPEPGLGQEYEHPCDNSDDGWVATDDETQDRTDPPWPNVPSRERRFVASLSANENVPSDEVARQLDLLRGTRISRRAVLAGTGNGRPRRTGSETPQVNRETEGERRDSDPDAARRSGAERWSLIRVLATAQFPEELSQ